MLNCCSRVTRSWTAARTAKCRRAVAASSHLHSSPYWMRRPRTVSAGTNCDDPVVTADTGVLDTADTTAGCDGFRRSACTSNSYDCDVERPAFSPRTQKMQASDGHCVSSRSSRHGSVKSSDCRKPCGSEVTGMSLESNSSEGHSSTSWDNAHHRLHCGDCGECCPCTTPCTDDVGVSSGPADCNRSPCLRVSSAATHNDRPWVSTCALLPICDVCLRIRSYLADSGLEY